MQNVLKELSSLFTSGERLSLLLSLIGIIIGIITSQFNVLIGTILFSTFLLGIIIILVYAFYIKEKFGHLYHTLEHDQTWELLDEEGREVIHIKRMKIRFIQNNVMSIVDYLWGDGEIFAEYECTPGKCVDIYRYGARYHALISLQEIKNRGDIMEITIQRKILNGFLNPTEWVELDIYSESQSTTLTIIFPDKRPCKQARLVHRITGEVKELEPYNFSYLKDGRQKLFLSFKNPPRHEMYTIRWNW